MTRPIIAAIGISDRDVELGTLWCRWVNFLGTLQSNEQHILLVVYTKRAEPKIEALKQCFVGTFRGEFRTYVKPCPDDHEVGYPGAASHLFLRTLEMAEVMFPGHAILWGEADTVPMKPSWFAEIAAEYQTCGKPFLGVTVGTKHKQLSGIAVYPADWRKLAPKLASVLSAPDMPQWGHGKGMPWDVFARDQTVPQMAESRLLVNTWKNRLARPTRLADIPASTCLYHQEKSPALIMELAAARYPEFLKQIAPTEPRYFMMNGHESRLKANGFRIAADKKRFGPGGWTTVFTTEGKSTEIATILGGLVGMFGFREIPKKDYDAIT